MRELDIDKISNFTEKQERAEKLVYDFKYLLYGGAMAGGKSYWLRWMLVKLLVYWAINGVKHPTVALFCEDFPSLKDRHISRIKHEFPPELGVYNATDHNFTLKARWGGGTIAFRNLDDASKYQSSEFAAIAVDELTKNDRNTFDFLRTRLRWKGIKHPKFIAATNPGGKGSQWVKQMWLDRIYDPNEKEQDQFMYVAAKASDNPYITGDYMRTLESMPEVLRRAFLEGDWDVFQGQYFKEWRRDLHVIVPKQPLRYHKKYICVDYGYAAPSCALWFYVDEFGRAIFYRELYKTGLTYRALMGEICAMTPLDEEIQYMVADPAIWAKKGENDHELSGADIMQAEYQLIRKKMIIMQKGDNRRVPGWTVMREYLAPAMVNGVLSPRMLVCETCPNLIRTLPALIYDEKNVEDCDSDGEDHAPDAARYGLMSRPQASHAVATTVGDKVGRLLGQNTFRGNSQYSPEDRKKDSLE